MADVFLFWCRHGVDGFRCDAGYMVPAPAWHYIVAKVRREFPRTIFLLEGLGGPVGVVEELLGEAGLDWAYSELFQNYSKEQIEGYFPRALRMSSDYGLLVHVAETHDNDRLAGTSFTYAAMRTALCALLAPAGATGLTNGAEWFATEKFDVHGATSLNWGGSPNQTTWLTYLHRLLDVHSAFHAGARIELFACQSETVVAVRRIGADGRGVLVLGNLDIESEACAFLPGEVFLTLDGMAVDLLSGDLLPAPAGPSGRRICLRGGQVVCLARDPGDAAVALQERPPCAGSFTLPDRIVQQRLRVTVMELLVAFGRAREIAEADLGEIARALVSDPARLVQDLIPEDRYHLLVEWEPGCDERRMVMLPPGSCLLVTGASPFRAELCQGEERVWVTESFRTEEGTHAALTAGLPVPDGGPLHGELRVTVFKPDGRAEHVRGPILRLPHPDDKAHGVELVLAGADLRARDACGLCTNSLGSMSLVSAAWGELRSKYDALLAANLDPDVPVDRTVLFTRCRAWVVYRDYSRSLDVGCQLSFRGGVQNRLQWDFRVPVGLGRHCELRAELSLSAERNRARLCFARLPAGDGTHGDELPDTEPISLILRPQIEDRGCHEVTKAYTGPETSFPRALTCVRDGFRFRGEHELSLSVADGLFTAAPEWEYCVPYPVERGRGLEDRGDLFSPGYFEIRLGGGDAAVLTATAGVDKPAAADPAGTGVLDPLPRRLPLEEILVSAAAGFVVRRNGSKTVIAGYPWFLDWGRDTLICLRGLIAGGLRTEVRDILRQFARYEREGTLPNMIRGEDAGDRDTSDAPLWLSVAAADYVAATGDGSLLEADCGGRTFRQVLLSIAQGYARGTANGIRMDPDSALVFSPPHFTWMDTNYPAGTPRTGYPVEIQALWWAALRFLAANGGGDKWQRLADRVSDSVRELFSLPGREGLVDCLHADTGEGARQATPDDACRPNQLFAVTLGLLRDPRMQRGVVRACTALTVPGAIRSLADRPVRVGLPVFLDGALLNDPEHPYCGRYEGDEDSRRKPAYHNGTAWTWIFPSYCEALYIAWGTRATCTARSLLLSGVRLLQAGCTGHMPEITDGDAPHTARGCMAQAWGDTEFLRVHGLLASGASSSRVRPEGNLR